MYKNSVLIRVPVDGYNALAGLFQRSIQPVKWANPVNTVSYLRPMSFSTTGLIRSDQITMFHLSWECSVPESLPLGINVTEWTIGIIISLLRSLATYMRISSFWTTLFIEAVLWDVPCNNLEIMSRSAPTTEHGQNIVKKGMKIRVIRNCIPWLNFCFAGEIHLLKW